MKIQRRNPKKFLIISHRKIQTIQKKKGGKKKKEGERGRGREGGSERNSSFFEELVQSLGG